MSPLGQREDGPGPMTTRTMHMGGHATGAARLGAGCPTLASYAGVTEPAAASPWHVRTRKQALPVFITDRPIRRPSERFP
jgi:hypothetical protein